jgi:HAD superfamily hydrolase (TIGR01509 family)
MQLGSASYQAVLFDFNGVLLLDSPWHEAAWQDSLQDLTQRAWTHAEVGAMIHGRTNRDIFEQVLARPLDPDEQARLSEHKESRYRAICRQKGPAFDLAPGVPALLDRLRADGVRFTIATASGEINMRFYYQELALGRWFEWDAIAYDDGTIRGKPAPDIYLRAAQRLGVAPQQAVVVEDSLAGMRAARNAGTGYVVAVGDTQALPASDPLFDVRLGSLADFAALL